MQYAQLQKKLAETQLNINPAMQDVMQRVREVGLHKVATTLYDLDELSLPKVAQVLGTRLLLKHHKHQKIASGLRALNTLALTGDIKLANIARQAGRLGKAFAAKPPPIPAAARQAAPAAAQAGSSSLDTLMRNLGTKERGALAQAFKVSPEAVTPDMYMRAAHGVR